MLIYLFISKPIFSRIFTPECLYLCGIAWSVQFNLSTFLIYSYWIYPWIHMGLNWQSRCAVFLFENNRVSVDDATETWQGDDLHRKGTTPRRNRPCCVCSCGAMEVGPWRESHRAPSPPLSPLWRPRRIIELLVKPACTNTLFLFPCPSSPLLFLHFVYSFSIGPYIPFSTRYHLRTLAATLSRILHILPLPYQVLLDSPLLTVLSIWSLSY